MTIKEKTIQDINDQIWKLNYEIDFAVFIKPQAEALKEAAQKEADEIKAKLDEVATGDHKKKAVRDEMKQLAHAYGTALKKVGNYASVIQGSMENVQQHKEKIAGYQHRLDFLAQYEK